MKRIERYYFMRPPEGRKKTGTRIWDMVTLEEGRKKYPRAEPDLSSMQVQFIPETPEEIAAAGLGHGSGFGRQPSGSG